MSTPSSSTSTSSTMVNQLRFVTINLGTDGDANHVPSGPKASNFNRVAGDTLTRVYLNKLGTLWMKQRGEAEPDTTYQLNRLPRGYSVWERPRPGNSKFVDKYCYGHPSHKTFDSPNRFFPHFLSLMENGNSDNCTCDICKKETSARGNPNASAQNSRTGDVATSTTDPQPPRKGRPPGRPTIALKSAQEGEDGVHKTLGRQWVEGRVDEEGTPDPYRNNIDRLEKARSIDTIIEEKMSADWRAERACNIDRYFNQMQQLPAWLPRRMEMTLFVRALSTDESLIFDSSLGKYMIKSAEGDLLKEPLWEAGLVTQTAVETPNVEDILRETPKTTTVTTSGYRIEPISNANDKNGKGVWKQYTYVRLDQMRPFSLWQTFLSGLEETKLHPTIANAMLVASTLTLVKRYRFKGKWPEAKVYCKAMYLGAELILEGDLVCLLPQSDFDTGVKEVMKIESITLDMWNLDKSSKDDYDEGHPYNSAARLAGTVYTKDKKRAASSEPVGEDLAPLGLDQAGPWYLRAPREKISRVPFSRVMGRAYSPEVLDMWINGHRWETPASKIGTGMNGVIEARRHSSEAYRKIPEDRRWFWADTRVEALDLEEVNGYGVSSMDINRDPKTYRKEIRVIDGTAKPEEKLALRQQAERRASVRGAGGNSMLQSALEMDEPMESVETSRDRKRSRSALGRSSDEEEDEDEDNARFLDQMAEGMAMSDEEVPSSDEEEIEFVTSTPKGPRPLIVIDRSQSRSVKPEGR